ncbi:porin [Reyranella sp.]|uniref:porin n=1 Tax=Reyranella sp. TaxID=1929291 RepID=UPI002F92DC8A
MKKLLLGSTALVVGGLVAAPAMAADPIKMGVGGYYQFYALAGSMEGTYATNGTWSQFKGIQFIQEGEIHFIGQTKLDNGTSIGVRVELEGWNPSISGTGVRQIDEAYLFAFGDWGRIEFGSKDDAAYIMYYGAPSALLGFGFFQHNSSFSWTNPTANGFNKAAFHISDQTIDGQFQDVNRINYYTPRFAGLQIGVGYAPKINLSSTAAGGQALAANQVNLAGTCGYNDATTANGCPTADYAWQDALAIGANYLNKFGDFSVAAYVAYSYASFVPGYQPLASAANTITGANLSSWKQFVAGLQFSAFGFTLGGSYTWDNNGLGSNYYTGQNNDTNSFAVGLMYETGPWQVSVGAAVARNNNGNGSLTVTNCGLSAACTVTTPATTAIAFGGNPQAGALQFGSETASKIEVGANYALGPGVKMIGGLIFNNLSGPSNAVAAQSWAALLGMDFRF